MRVAVGPPRLPRQRVLLLQLLRSRRRLRVRAPRAPHPRGPRGRRRRPLTLLHPRRHRLCSRRRRPRPRVWRPRHHLRWLAQLLLLRRRTRALLLLLLFLLLLRRRLLLLRLRPLPHHGRRHRPRGPRRRRRRRCHRRMWHHQLQWRWWRRPWIAPWVQRRRCEGAPRRRPLCLVLAPHQHRHPRVRRQHQLRFGWTPKRPLSQRERAACAWMHLGGALCRRRRRQVAAT
jgi:hypothetical protein